MRDPEPCERCGAPVFLTIVHSKPMWEEVVCLCFARDHHRFQGECRPRVQHTPQRCTAERARRGGSTEPPAWTQPPRHPSFFRADGPAITFEEWERAGREAQQFAREWLGEGDPPRKPVAGARGPATPNPEE